MKLRGLLDTRLYIDMRGSLARVVQGRHVDERMQAVVDNYCTLTLPRFLEEDLDKGIIATAARAFKNNLQDKNMNTTKAVVCLGLKGIIVRNVRVPAMKPKDLQGMMKLEINNYLPVSPEDYDFDYRVMNEFEEEGRKFFNLLVAAVNRDHVERWVLFLEKAGIKPEVLDILPNVYQRLFGFWDELDTMVVDAGVDGAHLAIYKGKTLFLYDNIPVTLENIKEAGVAGLAGEMGGYIDYFSSRNFGKTIDSIRITGELSEIEDIQEMLEEYFTMPVKTGSGIKENIKFSGRGAGIRHYLPLYAGNLGLMMRKKEHSIFTGYQRDYSTGMESGITAGV